MQLEGKLSTPPLMRNTFFQVRKLTIEIMKGLPPRVVFNRPAPFDQQTNCYTNEEIREDLDTMGMQRRGSA